MAPRVGPDQDAGHNLGNHRRYLDLLTGEAQHLGGGEDHEDLQQDVGRMSAHRESTSSGLQRTHLSTAVDAGPFASG
jgi:hypothetical protein